MKRETLRNAICTALVGFAFCLGAHAARAQNIQPFVDCVERERDTSGALTGKYVAHFGYINYETISVFIPLNSAGNFLTPVRNPPNQPTSFLPGVHPRVLSVTLDAGVASETWRISFYSVTATVPTTPDGSGILCGSDSQNTRLMTYQGRLSDGAAAANGSYDVQFQLFNAATGGTARTTPIALVNVPVVNGIFTVQLNLGASATINPTGRVQALNAAILAGEDDFFEIGVRPGNSTGSFTILTPRQPLTVVPLAMRADSANNAVRAALADNADIATNSLQLGGSVASQFIKSDDTRLGDARTPTAGSGNYIQNTTTLQPTSNFNISGSGTVGGNLVVTGILSSGCRIGFTAIAGGRLCVSAMQAAATFYGASGAIQTCTNMRARVGNSADVMLTLSQGGFNYFNGQSQGWLADHSEDNVWGTWFTNGPTPDFDGSSINVYTGNNGGAPMLQYRCVY